MRQFPAAGWPAEAPALKTMAAKQETSIRFFSRDAARLPWPQHRNMPLQYCMACSFKNNRWRSGASQALPIDFLDRKAPPNRQIMALRQSLSV
jgi:hypothetical protein